MLFACGFDFSFRLFDLLLVAAKFLLVALLNFLKILARRAGTGFVFSFHLLLCLYF